MADPHPRPLPLGVQPKAPLRAPAIIELPLPRLDEPFPARPSSKRPSVQPQTTTIVPSPLFHQPAFLSPSLPTPPPQLPASLLPPKPPSAPPVLVPSLSHASFLVPHPSSSSQPIRTCPPVIDCPAPLPSSSSSSSSSFSSVSSLPKHPHLQPSLPSSSSALPLSPPFAPSTTSPPPLSPVPDASSSSASSSSPVRDLTSNGKPNGNNKPVSPTPPSAPASVLPLSPLSPSPPSPNLFEEELSQTSPTFFVDAYTRIRALSGELYQCAGDTLSRGYALDPSKAEVISHELVKLARQVNTVGDDDDKKRLPPPLVRPRRIRRKQNDEEEEDAAAADKKRKLPTTPELWCHSCGTTDTPEWRRGPDGCKSLCNACGLHYAKILRRETMIPNRQPARTTMTLNNLLN